MKELVFVESLSPGYDYSKCRIIALNSISHYELLKRNCNHKCLSDFIDFEELIRYSKEYNELQKIFFTQCDEKYRGIDIDHSISFAPFHIMSPILALLFDSLITSVIQINAVLKEMLPDSVILHTSNRNDGDNIEYNELSNDNGIGNYDYLFNEVLLHYSQTYKYNYTTKIVPGVKKGYMKNRLRTYLKNTRTYIYYAQIKQKKILAQKVNKKEIFLSHFNYLNGKQVLFMDIGWGLAGLFEAMLDQNDTSFTLTNEFIITYKNTKVKNVKKLTCDEHITKSLAHIKLEDNSEILDAFCRRTYGISIDPLIKKRLLYIQRIIAPSLYKKSVVVNELMTKLHIDYVIGSMKSDEWKFVISYLASMKNNCSFIFIEHGYDMYDIDRTFWELPCNIYYAANEEFMMYLTSQFNDQEYHIKPDRILVNPIGFYE